MNISQKDMDDLGDEIAHWIARMSQCMAALSVTKPNPAAYVAAIEFRNDLMSAVAALEVAVQKK